MALLLLLNSVNAPLFRDILTVKESQQLGGGGLVCTLADTPRIPPSLVSSHPSMPLLMSNCVASSTSGLPSICRRGPELNFACTIGHADSMKSLLLHPISMATSLFIYAPPVDCNFNVLSVNVTAFGNAAKF